MSIFTKHDHDDLARLPIVALPDRYGETGVTCPAVLSNGTVCGEDLTYAHNVREYHRVWSWTPAGMVLGEANEITASVDEDPHLFCANDHHWAVPEELGFQ